MKDYDGKIYTYSWDDGTKMEFKDASWHGKDRKAEYIAYVFNVGWMNFPANYDGTEKAKIAVVCKERPPAPHPLPSTPRPPLPPPPPPSAEPAKCMKDVSGVTKGYTFGQYCYFVLESATANRNKKESGKYKFYIHEARKDCQKRGGQLPIIKNRDEATFMFKHFQQKDYDPKGQLDTLHGVALGMKPVFNDVSKLNFCFA